MRMRDLTLVKHVGGILVTLAFLCVAGVQARAQSAESDILTPEVFETWADLGKTIETSLEAGSIEKATHKRYLDDLTGWRTRFDASAARWEGPVDSLLRQLDALGEVPEGGESEELAARRNEIEAELRSAVARLRRAEEASAYATSLIERLEKDVRSSWRSRLLTAVPPPLSPKTIWVMIQGYQNLVLEWPAPEDEARPQNELASVLTMLAGLSVIIWGPRLLRNFRSRVATSGVAETTETNDSPAVAAAELAVPLAGLVVLVGGVASLLPPGPQGSEVLSTIWRTGLIAIFVRWFVPRAVSEPKSAALLGLEPAGRDRVVTNLIFLGFPFVIGVVLIEIEEAFDLIPEAASVLGFLILAVMSISLFAIGRTLAALARPEVEEGLPEVEPDENGKNESIFAIRLANGTGYALMILAFAGVLIAAFGYLELARYFVWEPTLTIWLMAFVLFLHGMSDRLFDLWSEHGARGSESLGAAIARLVIALLCLPILAWIWGIRSATWSELWYGVSRGITIGELHISPGKVGAMLVTLALGFLATRFVQGALRYSLLPRTQMRRGTKLALVAGIGYVGFAISVVAAFAAAGMDPRGLAVVAGALSVGIGFGLQGLVSNFLSGIVLLVERPFTVGDWIEIDNSIGIVTKVSTRSTTIETFDKTDVVIPNAMLVGNKVTNWTLANNAGRLIISIGVGYDSDTEKVERILREVAAEHPLVVPHPPPLIVFQNFGDNALEFEVRVILRDINFGLSARTQLNHRILARLREEGIRIPYPQRDVTLTNIEKLRDLAPDVGTSKGDAD